MSYVIEARMDAIKRLSNEKRAEYEDAIENIKEKMDLAGRALTPDQYSDWSHMLKFRQMELALDDLAIFLTDPTMLDTKKDDALEAIRLYHDSCCVRQQRKVVSCLPRRPDSPYVCTEIFTLCENHQSPYDTDGPMLAQPMIIHPQEHRCSGERVEHWSGDYIRCDNDDDPDCPQYNSQRQEDGALPPADEDIYA